ncbi:MAG: cell division protein FtsQ/DivIB [Proteobacteria bacterium]|nr:cell division protein FtsQ/DivIB [Pseudomonadota bacterium]
MNRALRTLAWLLAVALVVLPALALINGWIKGGSFPMRRLEVSGPFAKVSAAQVRAVVLPQVKGGFFFTRVDAISRSLAAMPWVEHVEVRKQWPDLLVVHYTERHAFARWGADKLLSERGGVFAAPGSPDLASLPALDGPDGRSADVVALYNQSVPLFAAAGRHVLGVSLSDRDSWTVHLADGVDVVVGRHDTLQRLRRFAGLLPRLVATRPGSTLQRADLRYTNGFALSWQDPMPAKPSSNPKRGAPKAAGKQQART